MQERDSDYRLTPDAFWGTTQPWFVVHAAPRDLLTRYGMPIQDGDSESLGTYVFTSHDGAVVTVYFRAYDVWSLLLKFSKSLFWKSKTPVDLSLGANSVEEGLQFAKWLSSEIGVSYRAWP